MVKNHEAQHLKLLWEYPLTNIYIYICVCVCVCVCVCEDKLAEQECWAVGHARGHIRA